MTNFVVLFKPLGEKKWLSHKTVEVNLTRQDSGAFTIGGTPIEWVHSNQHHSLMVEVRGVPSVFIEPTGGNDLPKNMATERFGHTVTPALRMATPLGEYRVIHLSRKER